MRVEQIPMAIKPTEQNQHLEFVKKKKEWTPLAFEPNEDAQSVFTLLEV